MARSRATTALVATLLGTAPVLGVWIVKDYLHARPYWIHHYDPEVAYYHAARELLQARPTDLVHHPGTPLQVLVAAIVAAAGDDPSEIGRVLWIARWTLLLGSSVGVLALQLTVLRGLPLLQSTTAVWVFYVCGSSLESASLVAPEALYLLVGGLFLAALWSALARPSSRARVFAAGLMLGLCAATKFLFAAWLPAFALALVLSDRARSLARRAASALLGLAGAAVGFVVATLPVASHYPVMFEWLHRLASRRGLHGTGEATSLELGLAVEQWQIAVASAKGWYLILGACLLACLVRPRWAEEREGAPRFLALFSFASVALLASHALVVQHVRLHYLLPTGLIGVLLFGLGAHAWRGAAGRGAWIGIAVAVGGLLAKHAAYDLRQHRAVTRAGLELHEQVELAIGEHPRERPVVVFGFRAPQPSFADGYGAPPQLQGWLDATYPREGRYYPWSQMIQLPSGAASWDLVLIRARDVAGFPAPLGEIRARIGDWLLIDNGDSQDAIEGLSR